MEYELLEKKFSILQEITNAIVITDNVGAIANLMLDLAISYTNAEKGSFMLLNERNELYILASRGIDLGLVNTYRIKVGEGIAGSVALNRMPVLIEDIDKDSRFKKWKRDRYKTRSFISCPIISRNKLYGVLNINDKRGGGPFGEDEFTLIRIIANQAAIAIENAFLMNKLQLKAIELEEINRKLVESDITKTEFLTRVSHELRTPLNSVKGSLYYLRQHKELGRGDIEEFYEIISEEVDKLIYIVENQLDFLRVEDETKVTKKSLLDISDLLRDVINSRYIRSIINRRNINIRLEINNKVSLVAGDRVRVFQLFINLIESLCHHLEFGENLTITLQEDDFLNVLFTLPGQMPETLSLLIRDPVNIFKIDRSKERLKLYLAKRVAEAHRWPLSVESRPDFSVITMTIPKIERLNIEVAIESMVEVFTEFIAELMEINVCSIMLADEFTGDLMIKGAIGLDEDIVRRTRLRIGDNIAGWVALEGRPLLIEDIENDPRFVRKNLSQYNTRSLLSLPLKVNGKVFGVMNLNNKRDSKPFTVTDLYIARAISERLSYLIKKLYSQEYDGKDIKNYMKTFEGLVSAVKYYHKKDGVIHDLVNKIMDYLGVDEETKNLALYTSMLYDIGLMLTSDVVLKGKALSPAEIKALRVHPYITIALLNSFEFSEEVKKSIVHHHERYDGTGYPEGLKGDEIPLISRVLSVVDSFNAMTSDRPYRDKLSPDKAIEELKRHSGTLYDPKIVNALAMVVET